MRARLQIALTLLLVSPTLVVPIEKWHHHQDGHTEHEHCALCIAAAAIVSGNPPAMVLPALGFVCLQVPQPDAPVGVFRAAPAQARAPPPAQFSA
jgi:hypothetical protein